MNDWQFLLLVIGLAVGYWIAWGHTIDKDERGRRR